LTLYKNKYRVESIRKKDFDYSSDGYYFVTICTKNRESLFSKIIDNKIILNQYGKILEDCWFDLPNHYQNIQLDKYMIMPNHFNGIIKICNVIVETGLQPVSTTEILSEFVRALKTFSSKRINKLRNISKDEKGFKPFSTVWQPGFYDHIIRNNKDLNKIRKYINDNPLFLDDRNL